MLPTTTNIDHQRPAMRGVLLALLLLAPVVSTAAGVTFLTVTATAGGGGDSTNWQASVNALTNGAALGATALQPPATNDLAAAAAHAATAHGVTQYGGFQGGGGEYTYAEAGGAVGYGASTMSGGAVGHGAYAEAGGAVGNNAYATYGGAVGHGAYVEHGGAVGNNAYATYGGAVGLNAKTSDGFAGGKNAFATTDGNLGSPSIDAIQLGTGGNSEPFSLQIYNHKLMRADGTIPVERLTMHNTDGLAHADIRALVGGASGSIVKPIIPASATVAVTSTQAVYQVDTSTAITLTNDLSDLALTGTQEAAWSVALNLTDWPATSTVFAANIEWDQEPELTVTGCYRFAFSSSGGTVQGRQTFPQIHDWQMADWWEGTASRSAYTHAANFDAATDYATFIVPNVDSVIQTMYSIYAGRFVPENGMQIKLGLPNSASSNPNTTSYPMQTMTNWLIRGNGNQIFRSAFRADTNGVGQAYYGPKTDRVYLIVSPGTTNTSWTMAPMLHGILYRPQNRLEINAYGAGWRP